MESVAVGQCCIALYDVDETWYRAQVLAVNDDKVDVLFVDYGNRSTVSFSNIKTLTSDIADLPLQSFQCKLAKVYPSTSQWDSASCSRFEEMVNNKELSCKVCSVHSQKGSVTHAEVELCQDTGVTVAQQLIQEGYGTSSISKSLPIFPLYPKDTEINVEYISGDVLQHFYCTLTDCDDKLTELSHKLSEYYGQSAPTIPKESVFKGTVCVVQSQSSNTWCRAVVLDRSVDTCKVLYIYLTLYSLIA